MKKKFIFITVFLSLLTYLPYALAVSPSMNWSSVMNLPSESEIRSHVSTGRAPYIVVRPDFRTSHGFSEYAVDFRADYVPIGTYVCVCNFELDMSALKKKYTSVSRDYPGVGGYAGFQRGYDDKGYVIMTVWDTYCRDKKGNQTIIKAKGIAPAKAPFERAEGDTVTGEGSFIHCVYPFDWKAGHDYRALIQMYGSRLQFWVMDLQTNSWTQLMEYDLGYEGAFITYPCAFLEDFSWRDHAAIRSMLLYNFRARDRVTGKWIGAKKAGLSENYEYNGSYAYGAKGNAFYAITTNLPGRCPAPKQNLNCTVTECDTSEPY